MQTGLSLWLEPDRKLQKRIASLRSPEASGLPPWFYLDIPRSAAFPESRSSPDAHEPGRPFWFPHPPLKHRLLIRKDRSSGLFSAPLLGIPASDPATPDAEIPGFGRISALKMECEGGSLPDLAGADRTTPPASWPVLELWTALLPGMAPARMDAGTIRHFSLHLLSIESGAPAPFREVRWQSLARVDLVQPR